KALELLFQMQAEGIAWTPRACSAALRACGEAGLMDRAVQLTGKMRQSGVNPSDDDYVVLIRMCVPRRGRAYNRSNRGGSSRVLELLQHMEDTDHAPKLPHFNEAIMACGRAGDTAIVSQILQEMHRKGVRPNIITWNARLDALGGAGLIDQMLATYKKMQAARQRPNIYTITCMLSRVGSAGERQIAEDLGRI
ncbi:hypothetical protein JKP88DRAFT_157480, partial [Tribonema minus]